MMELEDNSVPLSRRKRISKFHILGAHFFPTISPNITNIWYNSSMGERKFLTSSVR